MKAYRVFDREGECGFLFIVFAESRGKAISYALGTEEFPDWDWSYTELRAKRTPRLDKYYRGKRVLDWFDPEDCIALVKEGYRCPDKDWMETLGQCKECPAKDICSPVVYGQEG